jgi:hypothetical protein
MRSPGRKGVVDAVNGTSRRQQNGVNGTAIARDSSWLCAAALLQ